MLRFMLASAFSYQRTHARTQLCKFTRLQVAYDSSYDFMCHVPTSRFTFDIHRHFKSASVLSTLESFRFTDETPLSWNPSWINYRSIEAALLIGTSAIISSFCKDRVRSTIALLAYPEAFFVFVFFLTTLNSPQKLRNATVRPFPFLSRNTYSACPVL